MGVSARVNRASFWTCTDGRIGAPGQDSVTAQRGLTHDVSQARTGPSGRYHRYGRSAATNRSGLRVVDPARQPDTRPVHSCAFSRSETTFQVYGAAQLLVRPTEREKSVIERLLEIA